MLELDAPDEEYTRFCTDWGNLLIPGEPVPDELPVIVLGNKEGRITATNFQLSKFDADPVGGVEKPGKSAHGGFTDDVRKVIMELFGRALRPKDIMFVVRAEKYRNEGAVVYHAPINSRRWLHLRIVPDSYDPFGDVPPKTRKALASMLNSSAKKIRAYAT